MPPKPKRNSARKKKTETIKKQKSLIDSRLLEISLKVDDYVYKDIPITPRNAARFLKEVSGYRDQCFGNKRSLQVIEKLERCMKGIIEEQQALQGCNSNITNYDTSNQRNSIIDKPSINTVYNEHVENDLSWIEDLKYVREISVEENIPVHYQNSFWKSSSLPNNWNEDEFLFIG